MPWSIKEDDRCPTGKPYGVVKDDDNALEGCHETEDEAKKQQAALYANEPQRSEDEFGWRHYDGPRVRTLLPGDSLEPLAIRAEADGEPTMYGYAAVFDTPARIDSALEGQFIERIARGAFKKTITENRRSIQVIYDHGQDQRFGRRPIAKITDLREDQRGLYFEAELLNTPVIREELLPGLRAGLFGNSFRYRPTAKPTVSYPSRASDTNPDLWPEVTVTELRMPEFGPTPFPIYLEAVAGVRSMTDEYVMSQLASNPEHLRALLTQVGFALPHAEPAPATPTGEAADDPLPRAATALPPLSREEYLRWLSNS